MNNHTTDMIAATVRARAQCEAAMRLTGEINKKTDIADRIKAAMDRLSERMERILKDLTSP